MAELIDKSVVVGRLRMIGAFEYNDTRRNAFKEILDMLEAQSTTTKEEIRNKAITEFAKQIEDEILTMFADDREYQIAHKTLEEIAEEMRCAE